MSHAQTDEKLKELDLVKVRRALISVSNKAGLDKLAANLKKHGVEIVSTGGTASYIENSGVDVTRVADVTDFPEMLDGRVKTLHPKIHGAILADRRRDSHMKQVEAHDIKPIDLVVINLYPFKETIKKDGVTLDEAIENIDIGGPAMLRSAAKNFAAVAVVVSPLRYGEIMVEMDKNDGALALETRKDLAKAVFQHTADYDEAIYEYLDNLEAPHEFPENLELYFNKIQDLRYGENPHQKAAYYRDELALPGSLVDAQQLHGKELSFNNILDLDAAWRIVKEFERPAAVVIKHTNPCGVAVDEDCAKAFTRAFAVDPVSAFGSVVAVNRSVDEELAAKLMEHFHEAIIAHRFTPEALEILMGKQNLRLISLGDKQANMGKKKDIRRIDGGILVQDADAGQDNLSEMKVATEVSPSEKEMDDMIFAWRVAKHVKSNAIVLAKDLAAVGIGAGQMSRVDASELAVKKAGGPARCKGAVMASDAFFPFRDALDAAAKAGVKAIIQPGGSIRDDEVIEAANEHKVAMVFTGKRHFRH